MKKILFILGFVSLLVAGCSDFFDTAPSNNSYYDGFPYSNRCG